MTVLPFRPRSGTLGPARGHGGRRSGPPRARVRGTFTTPDLARGTIDGWLRVLHCSVQGSSLRCLAVVSGALYDAAGERLGLASTRCLLPVRLEPDGGAGAGADDVIGTVLEGPLEVSLLGFRVHLDQTRLAASGVSESAGRAPGDVRQLHVGRRA